MVTALIDWAAENDVGFSQIVSLGDMADVDVGDYLDMLAGDAKTSAILLYLETIPNPRKFMSPDSVAAKRIASQNHRHHAPKCERKGGVPKQALRKGGRREKDEQPTSEARVHKYSQQQALSVAVDPRHQHTVGSRSRNRR